MLNDKNMNEYSELPSAKELLYKNTTKLSEQAITSFQIFAMKKTTWLIATLITVVFGGLGIGLCFVNTYIGVAVLIAGILGGVIFFPYLVRSQIKKQNELIFQGGINVNEFEFYENQLIVTNIDKNSESDIFQSYLYKDLNKIIEFADYVAIYINKNQSYLLDKRGMNKGTISEVLSLLKQNNIQYIDKQALGENKK